MGPHHTDPVVSSMATKYMYTPVDEQLNKLGSIAQENDCDLLVTKWMTRKRVGKFDLKMETSHRWALVVIPLGGDGGIGHAITIVGDLIFDSTQSHALKLGKNSWIGVVQTIVALKASTWRSNLHGKNIKRLIYKSKLHL
jgi:hypothetical protein